MGRVHPSGLEHKVLPVHVRERQDLRLLVHRDHDDGGVGAGDPPGHLEGPPASGDLHYGVRTPAVGHGAQNLRRILLRGIHDGIRQTVGERELQTRTVGVDHHDGPRSMRTAAHGGAQTGRTGTYDGHHGALLDVPDVGRPVSGRQKVAGEEGLLVGHPVRDGCQAVVRIGDPGVLRLSAVDAASKCPSSRGIGAVVHPSPAAEEALAAVGLHVDGDPVARRYAGDAVADLLHDTYELVPDDGSRNRPGDGTGAYVEVAGAYRCRRDADYCVPGIPDHRPRPLLDLEPASLDEHDGFHERLIGDANI